MVKAANRPAHRVYNCGLSLLSLAAVTGPAGFEAKNV
jgi:hypothetical protein